MKLPRGINARELVSALRSVGYEPLRQSGSHIRLVSQQDGQHHITVPNHNPIKLGTLRGILKVVAVRQKVSLDELLLKLGLWR